MVLTTSEDFSFEVEAAADAAMQAWEILMPRFQKPLIHAKPAQKWVRVEKIFEA